MPLIKTQSATRNLIRGLAGGMNLPSRRIGPPMARERLEALNKEHETSILISANTAEKANRQNLKRVGQAEVRGVSDSVDIYTID